MNEQINPSQELVNKVIDSINKPQRKLKKWNWNKILRKFAIPAMLVLSIFSLPLVGNFMNNSGIVENNNRFAIAAYASEDTTFEITKNTKVLLPAGICRIDYRNGGITFGWQAKSDERGETIPGGFTIIGDNIKSVNVESKYGAFRDSLFLRYATDEELTASMKSEDYIVNPVYLEGDDVLNLKHFTWMPKQIFESKLTGNQNEVIKEYMDTIVITVTFDDGEVLSQTAQITIDENTGDIYARIIE